ncbi:TrlF family AAA-like ATPase [Clostridium botulinum]|uniref:TrlF family AAA-like ATPase n=1 Tax=Clostridium botulinum TaxID=1491 RepID=UPI00077499F2|nr:ATP-binding protein [Clostridium botulinum]AUN04846.1 hypothetical protein RSJ19_18855 [Clostridium botulinum]MBN3396904.1 hypothetical protein [Clostridium botulinum]MBN3412311.1 hypothetical protein [Clostridium botulinum]
MIYTRGSVWSKWDLHIHTPKSICNQYGSDNEETWDKFISYLENLPEDVDVIGINDYYFIDGFEKVMEYKYEKGRLDNIKRIFPVLEFRVDTFASASGSKFQRINLHILFDIDYSNWKTEVKKIRDEFISQIHLSRLEIHKTKILSKENIIECGGNLKNGFQEVIPCTDEVFQIINSNTWKDNTFTFLGYKEWNNLDKGSQLRQFKDELYKRVNAFFTASPDDNFSRKQQFLEIFGDKVLIHSDDIHKFEQLEKDNYRCLTWIKANQTFEGLKQILIEPKERIKIQEINPFYNENKTNVIDNIYISNGKDWFEERKMEFNSGLVSIIGEKGAGKTALLDLIAIANDEGIYEKDTKTPYSFYNRAKEAIKGINLDIEYLGGAKNSYILQGQTAKSLTDKHAKVRYLSLKELESYCDEKYKFQDFIKDIILETFPEVSEFDKRATRITENIKKLNGDIYNLVQMTKGIDELENAIGNKKIEFGNHLKNQPKTSANFSQEQEEEYRKLITNEQGLGLKLKNNKSEQGEINELVKWLETELKTLKQNFINNINIKSNTYTFLEKSIITKLDIEFKVLNGDNLRNRYELLKSEEKALTEELDDNKNKMKPLEKLNNNLKEEQNITKKWYESKTKLETEITTLVSKMTNMQNNLKEIEKLREQLKELYLNLIKSKIEQKKKYEELKGELESDNNINFDVKIEFNQNKFFSVEDSIIKHGQGNSQEKIQDIIKKRFISKLSKVNEKELEDRFEDINLLIEWVNGNTFICDVFGDNRNSDSLLKKGFDLSAFYNWIFNDYYEVSYFINFKNRALETLSPGQKGLALMKIFLKLDKSTKPLLIDQPEDNLDNKSVYFDLVNDIRDIKKKRQVIIATHNPNLVVNTDSEQIIVAKFEDNPDMGKPKIKYYAGALEDIDIRKEVCDILEGGDIAFIKREKRYSLNRDK